MDGLSFDVCMKIFLLLDHQNLATAQKVCRRWKLLGSNNILWSNLFKERWGEDQAALNAPDDSKSWKDAYQIQDRCDRFGLGVKIIREGVDYYIVDQGEIQRHLGSKRRRVEMTNRVASLQAEPKSLERVEPCQGILDKILFFIGDLEVASTNAKRSRTL